MKPVIVVCRGVAFCAMQALSLTCLTGRRLQLVYRTNKNQFVDDRVFQWPWKVEVGASSECAPEDAPVF